MSTEKTPTVGDVLERMNRDGGLFMSLLCTDEGLLLGSAGDEASGEEIGGFTSLFDNIVLRAERDIDIQRVDEVTLLDPRRGRIVIRPINVEGGSRFFLVVRLPTSARWRRSTNLACAALRPLLEHAVGN